MKKSLNYLPEIKQEELQKVVETTCAMCDDVEMIILFGSYSRNEYKEEKDLDPQRRSGKVSDYDILVVTKQYETAMKLSLWHEIGVACRLNEDSPHTRIIAQTVKRLKVILKDHHFFYTDIVREGVLLYNPHQRKLHIPAQIPKRELERIARAHYNNWFSDANDFYAYFEFGFQRETYNTAAFQLHQAAECCLKCLLAVLTNYIPRDHWLWELEIQVSAAFEEILTIFPRGSNEERDRFENFDKAYISARYHDDYHISKEDLLYFAERVKLLIHKTAEKWEHYLPTL